MPDIRLLVPSLDVLPAYRASLERGWSPSNTRGAPFIQAQLAQSAADPARFVASLDDPGALAGDVELPDGTFVARLPGFARWIWDDAFCGVVSLRWPADGGTLPPHILGHIGYSVVPWQRRQGVATRALAAMLDLARARGLKQVEVHARQENEISHRVIRANGGTLLGAYNEPDAYGGHPAFRFGIAL